MNWNERCGVCGKFTKFDCDSYTPYGCSSYDPPEPYDPVFLCEKHAQKLYQSYLESFKRGNMHGDWCKSNAEKKAAKEFGLVWDNSEHLYKK